MKEVDEDLKRLAVRKFTPVVAVDFDQTLAKGKFPEVADVNVGAVNLLREFQLAGGEVILWTCRNGRALADAVAAVAELGLTFDAVNAEAPSTLAWFTAAEGWSPKVFANLYVDDKSTGAGEVDWTAVAADLSNLAGQQLRFTPVA